jgi:hypothetical protein
MFAGTTYVARFHAIRLRELAVSTSSRPGLDWQRRLGAVKRPDLGLLVHAQAQSPFPVGPASGWPNQPFESVGRDSRVRARLRAPWSSVRARSRPTGSARSRPICDRRRGCLELEGAIARKCDGLLQAPRANEVIKLQSGTATSIPSPPPVATCSRSSSHEESSERLFRTSRHRARDKRRPCERLARARPRLLHPRTCGSLGILRTAAICPGRAAGTRRRVRVRVACAFAWKHTHKPTRRHRRRRHGPHYPPRASASPKSRRPDLGRAE